jgi:hypothetical protein
MLFGLAIIRGSTKAGMIVKEKSKLIQTPFSNRLITYWRQAKPIETILKNTLGLKAKKNLNEMDLSEQEKPILYSLSVDAACSGNPGVMEYRGVFY